MIKAIVNRKFLTLCTILLFTIVACNSVFATNQPTLTDKQGQEIIFDDSIKIPRRVVNYAKRHNLQLEVDKYEIEKTDVTNGDKYKYIYPCSTNDGNACAILYKNIFYIKTAEPKARNIIYIGTR